jgi:hypothetical protein
VWKIKTAQQGGGGRVHCFTDSIQTLEDHSKRQPDRKGIKPVESGPISIGIGMNKLQHCTTSISFTCNMQHFTVQNTDKESSDVIFLTTYPNCCNCNYVFQNSRLNEIPSSYLILFMNYRIVISRIGLQ